jgi:hypothetical protein
MATTPSKKGSPAWRRGVERARAQAVALLTRIGPNTDQLTDDQRKKLLRRLGADLQRLVRAIDRHLGELPSNAPSPPPAAPRRARSSGSGRR